MHIVQLANFYGPRSGGLRTAVDRLGAGYVARGHRATLVVAGAAHCDELLESGVRRITVPGAKFFRVEGYRAANPVRIRRLLPRLGADSLEVSDRLTLRGMGPWARARGIGAVMISHERLDRMIALGAPRLAGWASDIANLGTARSYDTVVCTTAFAGEEFARIHAPNVATVPLGVDLDVFRPERATPTTRTRWATGAGSAASGPHRDQPAEILLVQSCRLSMEKHPARGIEVLRALIADGASARLVIAGGGAMLDELRRQAAGLPVTFTGHLADRGDLADLLAAADVAICPGPHETFGLSAMEALASGTPIVVSRNSALAEIARADCGLPSADTGAAFTTAVRAVLARGGYGAAARARAEEYTWDRAVHTMLDVHRATAQRRAFLRADRSAQPVARLRVEEQRLVGRGDQAGRVAGT
ncbi:glycosyltransferase [Tsukamurella paurometabola]|uniref:Glycosyl transferase group 1 n=1 Tax=Tsukamurella paurometabola (strain ATCC 8368 / DSM 20162 / CCUG 35730 / CIP 100753 / JCM 10117 / KCTC 9821 / NBRC 16120 / NCIMB 702349 / NCTC 13040) TaxID=521096 RepID=D5UX85_TSUPD|nr:glycosyltransferase [Tsukamurella paurometabola]ADG80104.1 glycosyl transferase group 1 [Tsukamurella paurometabola DSM 20162]